MAQAQPLVLLPRVEAHNAGQSSTLDAALLLLYDDLANFPHAELLLHMIGPRCHCACQLAILNVPHGLLHLLAVQDAPRRRFLPAC